MRKLLYLMLLLAQPVWAEERLDEGEVDKDAHAAFEEAFGKPLQAVPSKPLADAYLCIVRSSDRI